MAENDAEGAGTKAKRILREVTYPHNIHPAMVPGVSVEDQKIRYRVDKPMLTVVGGLVVAFILWGVLAPEQVFDVSSTALDWIMTNLGWVFTMIAVVLFFILLVLAFSKYGRIPLGLDDEKPEYSTLSWAAMLFAAGIGIGIIFFGPYEPLSHYLSPRPGAYEAASEEAIKGAMVQSTLHWGASAWAIYGIVGLCVAYVSFRRGRVPLMSSIMLPLLGNRSTDSLPARIIDGLAIIATLFGTAATLGIGSLQIASGFEVVSGWSTAGNTVALIIIMVLTIATIASAVSGVAKGIRVLSNINLVLSIGIAVFFFVVGPTAFLMNALPAVMIEYFASFGDSMSAHMGEGEEMQAFLSAWTTFYWAWWISWAPFVGVFVAKISRGRTIRQFVLGVLFIPSTIIMTAFAVLGGTTIWLQNRDHSIAPDGTADTMPAPEEIFFVVLDQLPGAHIIAPIIIVVLIIFFVTTADSASLVNSQLSQKGNPNPNPWITTFWVLCMAGIAVVILLSGGQDALRGMQNLVVVTALPFAFILILMSVALFKELRNDPFTVRRIYGDRLVANSVKQGVSKYGDNFALAIEECPPDSDYSAGGNWDSHAAENVGWYTRTDEQGRAIEYDYETGEYLEDVEPYEATARAARGMAEQVSVDGEDVAGDADDAEDAGDTGGADDAGGAKSGNSSGS